MKLINAEEIDECVLEINPIRDRLGEALHRTINGNIFQLVSGRCHHTWDFIYDEIRDRKDEHN